MKLSISKSIVIATLLASSLSLASSCKKQDNKQAEGTQETPIAVRVQAAETTNWIDKEVFSATVEAKTTNKISSTMGGRVLRLKAEIGQTVARNQVLAEMDNAQLVQAKLQLDEQVLQMERIDALYRSGGISKAEWESRQRAVQSARTNYNTIASNTRLVSPIHGVITARNYDAGDVTTPTLPIFVVEQLNPVRLKIYLPEKYYSKVAKGKKVAIRTETLPDETFEGSIALIYPTIDPSTHTFATEVEVPNGQLRLRSGMYASVEIDFGSHPSLVVWDRSVVKQMGSAEKYVFVANKDRAVRRKVVVGKIDEGKAEIISGVREGEQIIREGASTVKDGSLIKIIQPAKSK